MLYHKIVNPETGRSVNLNSKLGKRIIKKYINNQSGGTGNNGAKDYKKKIKYYDTQINKIADGVNKEHDNIHKDHVQKIEKMEMENDNHNLDIRNRHLENYKSAAKQYHDNQDNYHKSVKKTGMKCYRSKKKGTCELEPYFLGIDTNVDDEDMTGNKCLYDDSKLDCYADFSKWSSEDYTKLHDTLHHLDYDDRHNLFWKESDGKLIPFSTSQRTTDLVGKGHGTLSHF